MKRLEQKQNLQIISKVDSVDLVLYLYDLRTESIAANVLNQPNVIIPFDHSLFTSKMPYC